MSKPKMPKAAERPHSGGSYIRDAQTGAIAPHKHGGAAPDPAPGTPGKGPGKGVGKGVFTPNKEADQ